MKERFAGFLVTNNRIILIIFIVLALACGALIPFVNVNRDMTKYMIGTMSDMDMPLGPSALGSRSLSFWMGNLTLEQLQKELDEVRGMSYPAKKSG